VTEAGGPCVSLVKIDVQGGEMLLLEGAKRTLENTRPALFVEVDDRALRYFGSSARALVTRREAAGDKMHEPQRAGRPVSCRTTTFRRFENPLPHRRAFPSRVSHPG
jgi:hypothetical protein